MNNPIDVTCKIWFNLLWLLCIWCYFSGWTDEVLLVSAVFSLIFLISNIAFISSQPGGWNKGR